MWQPRCHSRFDRRSSTQLQPAITALIGQPKERAMKRQSRRTLCAAGLITAALASGVFAQQQEEKLGTLSFPTYCDPKVQAEFERGVAMIHSYWFLVARRVFEGVLQHDPGCAIAYWGIAMDLLGNSLGGPPSRHLVGNRERTRSSCVGANVPRLR